MKRASRAGRQEHHREKIEKSVQEPSRPEFRSPVKPWVVHRADLADAESVPVGQHRDEAVQLAAEPYRLDDLGAVSLETAIHVVEPDPGHRGGHRVEEPGSNRL